MCFIATNDQEPIIIEHNIGDCISCCNPSVNLVERVYKWKIFGVIPTTREHTERIAECYRCGNQIREANFPRRRCSNE
jgi:hypothetical protein